MFDQLVVGAAPGDAITQCALAAKDVLDELKPSALYAQFRETSMEGAFRPADELRSRPNRERPLIFHASIGCEPLFDELMELERRVILWYHNIAPAELLVEFSSEVAADLIRGRDELTRLVDRTVFALADSEFNAAELRALGCPDVVVVPPMPDVNRLLDATPDRRILERLDRPGQATPVPLVLVVGQLMPHKRIERAVAAVAALRRDHGSTAVLGVTGLSRLDRYTGALRAFADVVGLDDVEWFGRVSDAELAALYGRADVLLVPSEHEGFCVPPIEAMSFGVPVVASRRAALPETIGDAGLLLDDPDDTAATAAVLHEVLTNTPLRAELARRGGGRARRFDRDAALARFAGVVREDLVPLA
jgi:glycosyltransferase involved in cell wall biosynthesis